MILCSCHLIISFSLYVPKAILGDPDTHVYTPKTPKRPSPSVVQGADNRVKYLQILAGSFPSFVVERDKEGRSILHYASRLDSATLVKEALALARFPISLDLANANGALPLHNAARFSESVEVVNCVKDLYPVALKIGNNIAALPLYWAAAKSRNTAIVDSLLDGCPRAIFTCNDEG
jgi:hypothetical protein